MQYYQEQPQDDSPENGPLWMSTVAQGFLDSVNSSLIEAEQQQQQSQAPRGTTFYIINASDTTTTTNFTSYNNPTTFDNATSYNTTRGGDYNNSIDDDLYLYDDYFNNKWLLILPRVFGVLSLFAILCVAMETFTDLRQVRKDNTTRVTRTTTARNVSTITHIQFFYQIPLFCQALAFALGTTTAPQGQAWGAIGNEATCSFQGFLMQFGLHGCVGWDACLSMAYILMVRYKVAEVQLQSYKKYYHLIIWPISLAVSIFPFFTQMYNLNGTICWLESLPNNCVGDECIRGEGAPLFQSAASMLVMLHLVFSVSVMIALYCAIRGLENDAMNDNASERDGSVMSRRTINSNHRRYSKAVGVQGMYYASAMLITSLPTPIYIVLWNTAEIWNDGYAIFATSMVPLLGFCNMVLFLRKRRVKQCHTRYAKFIRRCLSFLFDYDYWGWIKKRCGKYCRCCGSKDDEEVDDFPLVSGTATRVSNRSNRSNPQQPPRRSISPNNKRQPRLTLASIQEDNPFAEEPDDNNEVPGKRGTWTGFLIKVKDQSQKLSQWVSELGASRASSGDSSSEDSSESDNVSKDNPPSRPRRSKSRIEALNGMDDKAPPAKPVRSHSEVDSNEFETDSLSRSARTSRSGRTTQSAKTAPPTMPIRCTSEVEPIPDLAEMPPQVPQRYTSEVEAIPDLESPRLPQRYVSEVEPNDIEMHPQQAAPPQLPKRYTSEVEQMEGAPRVPQRYTSEIETSENDELEHSSQQRPPQRYRYAGAAFDLECPRQQFVSEIEMPDLPQAEAPPSIPVRFMSEVELSESDSSHNNCTSPRRRYDAPTCYLPPNMPLRYESEIEMDGSSSGHHSRLVQLGGEGAPPTQPIRYASELDTSESNSSLEGSFHHSYLYHTNPAASPHRDAAPPTRPLRFPSEVDDTSKHNGSSILLPLDVITEHSTDTFLTPPKRLTSEVEIDESSFAGDGSSSILARSSRLESSTSTTTTGSKSRLADSQDQLSTFADE